MELLLKMLFYDLLGYTLPGTVVLGLWQWNVQGERLSIGMSTADWVMLIVLGYLVGIMISEVAERVFRWGRQVFCRIKYKRTPQDIKGPLERACIACGITSSLLAARLHEEKILENANNKGLKDLEKYRSWIYSVIQRDSQSRIHNYATAALLYKNMVVVSAFVVGFGVWYGPWQQWAAGLIGILIFWARYIKFDKKKLGYALCWFVKKQE